MGACVVPGPSCTYWLLRKNSQYSPAVYGERDTLYKPLPVKCSGVEKLASIGLFAKHIGSPCSAACDASAVAIYDCMHELGEILHLFNSLI